MSGYNQKAQQNIDDHIDFNLTPQKFIDLLTDAQGIVLPFGEMYEI